MANPKVFVVVSGGRGYDNYAHVERVLDEERPGVVVQGECPKGGADLLAKRWCRKNGVPCIGMEAMWYHYGRGAGPIRNGWMFDLLPIYKLIAFPGGDGTANAVKQAYAREILVRDERAAQVDTHAERRDVQQARPARVGSAVLEEDAPKPDPSNYSPSSRG